MNVQSWPPLKKFWIFTRALRVNRSLCGQGDELNGRKTITFKSVWWEKSNTGKSIKNSSFSIKANLDRIVIFPWLLYLQKLGIKCDKRKSKLETWKSDKYKFQVENEKKYNWSLPCLQSYTTWFQQFSPLWLKRANFQSFETLNSFHRFPDETLDALLRILLETNLSQNSPDQSQRTQTTKWTVQQ